jgi:hypothetical protein
VPGGGRCAPLLTVLNGTMILPSGAERGRGQIAGAVNAAHRWHWQRWRARHGRCRGVTIADKMLELLAAAIVAPPSAGEDMGVAAELAGQVSARSAPSSCRVGMRGVTLSSCPIGSAGPVGGRISSRSSVFLWRFWASSSASFSSAKQPGRPGSRFCSPSTRACPILRTSV